MVPTFGEAFKAFIVLSIVFVFLTWSAYMFQSGFSLKNKAGSRYAR